MDWENNFCCLIIKKTVIKKKIVKKKKITYNLMSRLSANSEDTGMSQVFTNLKFNCLSTYLESL